ncbi:hypothetical protein POJ06DRAFT_244356 [Lipomyces tetrasporus]|uniref:CCHC-type domain-containing protein n=1 Tax=Lipomyces tetrasporus TaxID=54092 RepID=A0AAD7VVL1_9ASCO|nr:uncharacterized protein POJ06DRAFT_244356 [Lipomyces tetrasporus]KAJ8104377.1 hypothetical protein POJ06DRAFT_244356 [Lipomyces tetrasporus]
MKLQAENSYLGAHRTCSLLLGQEFVGKGGSYLQARRQTFYTANPSCKPKAEPSVPRAEPSGSSTAASSSSAPKRFPNKRPAESSPQKYNQRARKNFVPRTNSGAACPRCRQQHTLAQCTEVRCAICGRLGHQADKCYSANWRPKQQ